MANLPYRILLQKNEYRVANPHQQFPFFSLFDENCQLCIHSDFDDDDKKCDIISSDDVFQHCFKILNINNSIGKEQSALINEAFNKRADISRGTYQIQPLQGRDDLERYKKRSG